MDLKWVKNIIIFQNFKDNVKSVEYMFKEVSALKNLSHKNIVKIYNCYTLKEEMKVALVLEFIEGGNLKEYIDEKG